MDAGQPPPFFTPALYFAIGDKPISATHVGSPSGPGSLREALLSQYLPPFPFSSAPLPSSSSDNDQAGPPSLGDLATRVGASLRFTPHGSWRGTPGSSRRTTPQTSRQASPRTREATDDDIASVNLMRQCSVDAVVEVRHDPTLNSRLYQTLLDRLQPAANERAPSLPLADVHTSLAAWMTLHRHLATAPNAPFERRAELVFHAAVLTCLVPLASALAASEAFSQEQRTASKVRHWRVTRSEVRGTGDFQVLGGNAGLECKTSDLNKPLREALGRGDVTICVATPSTKSKPIPECGDLHVEQVKRIMQTFREMHANRWKWVISANAAEYTVLELDGRNRILVSDPVSASHLQADQLSMLGLMVELLCAGPPSSAPVDLFIDQIMWLPVKPSRRKSMSAISAVGTPPVTDVLSVHSTPPVKESVIRMLHRHPPLHLNVEVDEAQCSDDALRELVGRQFVRQLPRPDPKESGAKVSKDVAAGSSESADADSESSSTGPAPAGPVPIPLDPATTADLTLGGFIGSGSSGDVFEATLCTSTGTLVPLVAKLTVPSALVREHETEDGEDVTTIRNPIPEEVAERRRRVLGEGRLYTRQLLQLQGQVTPWYIGLYSATIRGGAEVFLSLIQDAGDPIGNEWDLPWLAIPALDRASIRLLYDRLHGAGVVHNDLAMRNIMRHRSTGELRLVDFERAAVSNETESERKRVHRLAPKTTHTTPGKVAPFHNL